MLAALLGPATSAVVLFCVFLVQALLFQDGGVTALGLNLINMGLVGCFGGALTLVLASALVPAERAARLRLGEALQYE